MPKDEDNIYQPPSVLEKTRNNRHLINAYDQFDLNYPITVDINDTNPSSSSAGWIDIINKKRVKDENDEIDDDLTAECPQCHKETPTMFVCFKCKTHISCINQTDSCCTAENVKKGNAMFCPSCSQNLLCDYQKLEVKDFPWMKDVKTSCPICAEDTNIQNILCCEECCEPNMCFTTTTIPSDCCAKQSMIYNEETHCLKCNVNLNPLLLDTLSHKWLKEYYQDRNNQETLKLMATLTPQAELYVDLEDRIVEWRNDTLSILDKWKNSFKMDIIRFINELRDTNNTFYTSRYNITLDMWEEYVSLIRNDDRYRYSDRLREIENDKNFKRFLKNRIKRVENSLLKEFIKSKDKIEVMIRRIYSKTLEYCCGKQRDEPERIYLIIDKDSNRLSVIENDIRKYYVEFTYEDLKYFYAKRSRYEKDIYYIDHYDNEVIRTGESEIEEIKRLEEENKELFKCPEKDCLSFYDYKKQNITTCKGHLNHVICLKCTKQWSKNHQCGVIDEDVDEVCSCIVEDTDKKGNIYFKPCKGLFDNNKKISCCANDHLICTKCNNPWREDHRCNKKDKDTMELLLKDSTACPNCKVRIIKSDGCNDMWCTNCHTAFHFGTGKPINIQQGFHNPEYVEYLATLSPKQTTSTTAYINHPIVMTLERRLNFMHLFDRRTIYTPISSSSSKRNIKTTQTTIFTKKNMDEPMDMKTVHIKQAIWRLYYDRLSQLKRHSMAYIRRILQLRHPNMMMHLKLCIRYNNAKIPNQCKSILGPSNNTNWDDIPRNYLPLISQEKTQAINEIVSNDKKLKEIIASNLVDDNTKLALRDNDYRRRFSAIENIKPNQLLPFESKYRIKIGEFIDVYLKDTYTLQQKQDAFKLIMYDYRDVVYPEKVIFESVRKRDRYNIILQILTDYIHKQEKLFDEFINNEEISDMEFIKQSNEHHETINELLKKELKQYAKPNGGTNELPKQSVNDVFDNCKIIVL